jgi:hypothetical protein
MVGDECSVNRPPLPDRFEAADEAQAEVDEGLILRPLFLTAPVPVPVHGEVDGFECNKPVLKGGRVELLEAIEVCKAALRL